jgi:hypothetical protein
MTEDVVHEKLKQFSDVRTVFLTSIITALTFVVALFWNDAVRSAIESIIPRGEGPFYKFLAAIIVTILVVIVVYLILHSERVAQEKVLRKLKEQEKLIRKLKSMPVNKQKEFIKLLPVQQQKGLLKKKKGFFKNLF